MTLETLNKIYERNNIPKWAEMMSDSGWECCPTPMNGVWYNPFTFQVCITQGSMFEIDEELDKSGQWQLVSQKEIIEDYIGHGPVREDDMYTDIIRKYKPEYFNRF